MPGILIVEDEVITAMDLRETLRGLGYDVTGAVSTGEAAITAIEESPPDLVLMDILLDGEVDGIHVAETIRSRFAIPVIFATSQTDDMTVMRAMSASPYGFIIKPFETRELFAMIQTVLMRHSLEMEITKREQELARANRILVTMSDLRIAMLESQNEMRFLKKACDRVVAYSGATFAWIGYTDKGDLKKIHAVATAGNRSVYLNDVDIRWDDSDLGKTPAGKAVRELKGAVINDIDTDDSFDKWREAVKSHGFRSVAAEPLVSGPGSVGVISVYSSKPGFFDESMVHYLRNVSSVISQGILTMRTKHEREVAEKEVRALHDFYEKILENITEGILVIDSDGIVSYANGAVADVTGQKLEEFIGAEVPDVLPSGAGGVINMAYNDACSNRLPVSYDRVRVAGRHGAEEYRAGQMIPLVKNGRFESMIWTIRDVTEEVLAERWKYLYNLLAENSRDVILFVEKESERIIEANDAAISLYGYSLEEISTMRTSDIRASGMEESVRAQFDNSANSDILFETTHRTKDGSEIPVEVSMRSITIGDENLLVNIVRDIREGRNFNVRCLNSVMNAAGE